MTDAPSHQYSSGSDWPLPCPLCHSEEIGTFERQEGLFMVCCENDACIFHVEVCGGTLKEAIERWNTRTSPTPQIAGDETEQQFEDRLLKQGAADNLRLLDYIAHKIGLPLDQELSRENFVAWLNSLSPQAQAGETREKAEAWVWKDGIPAPAQGQSDRGEDDPYITDLKFAIEQNIKAARKYKARLDFMEVKYGAIDWDGTASPPAALPAGEVTLNADEAYHLFLIADTAARNERGKNKAVNHLRELLLPAYRAWHDANPGTAHPALAIPSTDLGGAAK